MPQIESRDAYAILGVPPSASTEAIKLAYRRLARRYHPDLNTEPSAQARMQDINWAYSILGDPARRAGYDAMRRMQSTPGYSPPPPPPTQTQPESGWCLRIPFIFIIALFILISRCADQSRTSVSPDLYYSFTPTLINATTFQQAETPVPLDSILPGTMYWEAIRKQYPDYNLTTAEGLSEEVVSVMAYRDFLLTLETRTYGRLVVVVAYLTPVPDITPAP